MKKLMFFTFWSIILLPNLLFPLVRGKLKEENQENRVLAEMPITSLYPFEFHPKLLEAYINDHAAFRDPLLRLYASLNLELFETVDNSDVIMGKDGWLFFAKDDSVPDYQRTNLFSEEQIRLICQKVDETADYFTSQGKTFVILFAPNKEQIYSRYMPGDYLRMPGNSRMTELVDYLKTHSRATIVCPQEEFMERADKTLLYYKTDTHWNNAGAFIAAQQLIEALDGGRAVSLEEMQLIFRDASPGDLARLAYLPSRYAADYQVEVEGWLDNIESVCTQLSPYGYQGEWKTPEAEDPRHLFLYRDSFGEWLIPVLRKKYLKVSACHYSAFERVWMEEANPDVIVYEIVERQMGRILYDLCKLTGQPG